MQRTAYESRSSDWSSYVCSSDLRNAALLRAARHEQHDLRASRGLLAGPGLLVDDLALRCLLVGRRLLADRELALALADEATGLRYLGAEHLGHGDRVLARKSVVSGKRVSVRVDLCGRRRIKKK